MEEAANMFSTTDIRGFNGIGNGISARIDATNAITQCFDYALLIVSILECVSIKYLLDS